MSTIQLFVFWGHFFWVPILVNRYEIHSGYGPADEDFANEKFKKK